MTQADIQDGNTRDESKMRRPELKDRLQDAWDRIDALEAENERLREALQHIHSQANDRDTGGVDPRDIWVTAHRALIGIGGDDE
jgi:cell shape-determining protein MreC